MKKFFCIIASGCLSLPAFSQTNTYDVVYSIFQKSCAGACHAGSNPAGQLNLSAGSSTVYNSLVKKLPVNPAAKNKGDFLVTPGDPHKSFLLRKINNGLDYDNGIDVAEGSAMPQNSTPLTNSEIEVIRQWILAGAKQTGKAVDTAVINKYYSGKGKNYMVAPLTPPPAGQGFQIHYGPIFMAPSSEQENFLEFNPMLPDSLDITRLDLKMDKRASHHFLLYKLKPGDQNNVADGLRSVNSQSPGDLVSAWQTPYNSELPANTAYRWRKDAYLDLNFHCFNGDPDSVVATDVRINVYTQPYGTAKAEMHTDLIHNMSLYIPNNNTDVKFTRDVVFSPTINTTMYVWILSSHTHKYGVDYDIYQRNPGGGKGTQLFEGFYDFNYNFNQGYYDWQHPPIRKFDPFLPLNPSDGLIHEAVYRNNGSKAVGFGVTTDDEMMLMFIQYTLVDVSTGIGESGNPSLLKLHSYPNPYSEKTMISWHMDQRADATLEVFNALGEKVSVLFSGTLEKGIQVYEFSAKAIGLPAGMYMARLTVNGQTYTQRMIEVE